jgi:GWxTD domain-containing protein
MRFGPSPLLPALAAVIVSLLACTHWSDEANHDPTAYALGLLQTGDTARAIERLETTDLSAHPGMSVTLARLYRSRGTIVGRLQAQRVLERALQLHPGDPRLLSALGRTYFEQTFFPDAVRCFRAALERDPGLCQAYYYLALYHYENWKRVNHYVDDLDSARAYLERTLACDPENVDAALRHAFSLYALDRPDSAARACGRLLRLAPEWAEPWLLRGVLAYDDGRLDDARTDFDRGLALLDPPTRECYQDVACFLPVDDRDEYGRASAQQRDLYARGYWLDLDPDPTTEINERRLEHVYRMFLADLFYSCKRPHRRGWDTERGQALVKFGWPDAIETTLGSGSRDGWRESWLYWNDGESMEFLFVDEFLNGNLRIPYRADYMVSVLRYSPRETDVELDFTPVPGAMDVVAFKDSDMAGLLLVAMTIDADTVAAATDIDRAGRFLVRGSLFDTGWVREHTFSDTLPAADISRRATGSGHAYDVIRTVPIPFGDYQVACTFQDAAGTAAAVFRSRGDANRYAGDQLAVSDILLERDGTEGATTVRGGRTLRPKPGRRYADGEALCVYFEIYNLGVEGGSSDYMVAFSIYESPQSPTPVWRRWGGRLARFVGFDEPPTISQTFRRSGRGHRQSEEMAIDVDSLDEGPYEVVVTVSDLSSGQEAQSQATFFRVAPGAGEVAGGESRPHDMP